MKFKIDHDLHIHSFLSLCSKDAEETPERMLSYAKDEEFSKICITDHFWDERVDGASDWYSTQNYSHLKKALPLPKDDGVTFLFGCETEMDKYFRLGISKERFDEFDFVIIPTSHLHMKGFTIEESLVGVKERAEYYLERCHALLDMELSFEKIGLAHFTCPLLARNSEGTYIDIINAISDREYTNLFDKAAKTGVGIELNLGFSDAANEEVLRPYRIAKSCGCKFYLGSDAHSPKGLLGARGRFEAIVNALGLTEEDKFHLVKTR